MYLHEYILYFLTYTLSVFLKVLNKEGISKTNCLKDLELWPARGPTRL